MRRVCAGYDKEEVGQAASVHGDTMKGRWV